MRIGPTDKSKILDKKSTALKATGYHDNKLRKLCFFTAIRHNYKTVVKKTKNKNKKTVLTAARCRENWPN